MTASIVTCLTVPTRRPLLRTQRARRFTATTTKAKIHRTRQRFAYPTPGLPLFGADRVSRAPIATCKAVPSKLRNARRHRRRFAKKEPVPTACSH